MTVALFVPCYIDQCYPGVGLAAVDVLERHGVDVDYPEAQTCCGQPMANSGCGDAALPLIERFARIFDGYDHVVCPSGSCASMVRVHYRKLLGDGAPPELVARVDRVARATRELCEFLIDVLKVEQATGRFPHKVGLHHSCHGLRELRLGSGSERRIPRFDKVGRLLAGLDGIELVEPARSDECCGFGGTFAVTEEAVSCAMGRDRIAAHERAGVEIMTAIDMSCLMHLDGLIKRDQRPLRVMHVAEILAAAGAR
jgi:L-lactate dehydrogenase complex protein LldE